MKKPVRRIAVAAFVLTCACCLAFGGANAAQVLELPQERLEQISKDGEYNSWPDVAAYISKYKGDL